MPYSNNNFIKRHNLWLSMIFSVMFPMLLGFILASYYSDWRWTHYPFHSMIESIGSLSALTIATLMILMVRKDHLPHRYILVACALISMGILDGVHAALHAGHAFVWLHSVATMAGGLIFTAIWLPESCLTHKCQNVLIVSITGLSLFIGILSVLSPDILPTMVINGEFSILAKVLNLSGGIGFLAGTSYFVYHKLKSQRTHAAQKRRNEDMVFANHCLLFGIAGLLFEFSVIWDAGWWWWHVLRLVAYLVVLVYFFALFKQQQDELSNNELKLSNMNKSLEQRVYERTKELEIANQAKTDFLSNMSHELRTPMNAILGFAQILDYDEKLNMEQKESVNEIMKGGNHLLGLISQVLDLAKIEAGKMSSETSDHELNSILGECLSFIDPLIKQHNIELVDKIIPSTNYSIHVDPIQFKQVVLNLLSNAIKYNSDNGRIILSCEKSANSCIRINVADTGKGLTEEEQNNLFKSFERLGEYEGIDGAGIGLVISKNLIELMNGKIGVKSSVGEGSCFWIQVPLSE